MIRLGVFLLTALLATACLGAEAPPMENLDVAYGPNPAQRLDIYQPAGGGKKRPAVLWIHGGGWGEGDKRNPPNSIGALAPALTQRGFVAVSCNYRLLPDHHHPAQLDDVQRVMRWLRAHAREYRIDPKRIGAVGISAGGHLVCCLAVRETRSGQGDELDKYSSKAQAVVSINGVTDMVTNTPEMTTPPLTGAMAALAGGNIPEAAQNLADASPIRFVGKKSAPTLFIIGTGDTLVPNAQSQRMAEALKAKGVHTEVVALEGAQHAIFPSISPPTMDATLDFMQKQLAAK